MSSGRKKNKKEIFTRSLRGLIAEILVFTVLMYVTFSFVIGVTVQKGSDMFPFIRDGDVVIYYRHAGLLPTEAVVYEVSGQIRTGRIAASPGSEIACTGDLQLTVDGAYMPADKEHGVYSKTYVTEDAKPMKVSNNAYYILNDDRTRMNDSRMFGEITTESILGRIVSVLRVRTI